MLELGPYRSSNRLICSYSRMVTNSYSTGSGIRLYISPEEEEKRLKAASEKEKLSPMQYILSGKYMSTAKDFHYTDRPAGKGYTNYAETIYPKRPWIWPPLRRSFRICMLVSFLLLLPAILDFSWFIDKSESIFPSFEAKVNSGNVFGNKKPPEVIKNGILASGRICGVDADSF